MGFNQAQKDAVTHGTGPCLVLAGPGSGKTLTIVNRIKYLIEEYKVRPEEILVVTFTRFAAAEVKSRLHETAYLNPELTIVFQDKRGEDPEEIIYHEPEGIVGFCRDLKKKS